MSDNESNALRELQEEARRQRAEAAPETPDSTTSLPRLAAGIVLLGIVVLVASIFIVDPYATFRMRVTLSMDNDHFMRIWSMECSEKGGRTVCSNDPGFGCEDHCTVREPETTVTCDRICSDPVEF